MTSVALFFLLCTNYFQISISQNTGENNIQFIYLLLTDKINVMEQKYNIQLDALKTQYQEELVDFKRIQDERMLSLQLRIAGIEESLVENTRSDYAKRVIPDGELAARRNEREVETIKSGFRSIQKAFFEQKSLLKNLSAGLCNKITDRPCQEENQSKDVTDDSNGLSTVSTTIKSELFTEQNTLVERHGVVFSGQAVNHDDGRRAADCSRIYQLGYRSNGVYRIRLNNTRDIHVKCNLQESTRNWNMGNTIQHLRGWTVVQNREGYSNFNRTWAEYKNGFGDIESNFWLGNDILYRLINGSKGKAYLFLRFYAQDYGYYYRYLARSIRMESESSLYTFWYSGLSYSNKIVKLGIPKGVHFTTYDTYEGDTRCPIVNGGWWNADFPPCVDDYSVNTPNTKYVFNESISDIQGGRWGFQHENLFITGSEMLVFVDSGY